MTEQRFQVGFEEEATDEPGLVLGQDGIVELVAPGGARSAFASNGGSKPIGGAMLGARATEATTSDLYELGAIPKPIGPTGYAITGLAFDATTDTLYGVTSGNSAAHPRSLISIEPTTGEATFIGAIGHSVSDIACDSSGALFGAKVGASAYQRLLAINKTTGAGSVVGSAPSLSLTGAGVAFHPDGTLYMLSGDLGAGAQVKLYEIDPATGAISGPFGLSGVSPNDFAIVPFGGSDWFDPIAALAFTPDGTFCVVAMVTPSAPVKVWVGEITQDENVSNEVVDSGIRLGRDRVNGLAAIEWVPARAF